jgi:phosphohistidine phosphatase
MKRLMLLRHAKTERAAPGQRDRDRRLTRRGRDDAEQMAAYMAQHALMPDRVLLSPTLRTRETWERMVAAFAAPPPVDREDRLYESGADNIVAAIREATSAASRLLVVGHNPALHETARLLIGAGDVAARERLDEGLPTAGLVVIDFAEGEAQNIHPHGGRLERFVTPRLLSAAIE